MAITLVSDTAKILNAIRNSATQDYKNHVPVALNNAESVRSIGNIILDTTPIYNEFLTNLINKIGLTWVTSKMYNNRYSGFKKYSLEYGETIEEIFVNLANVYEYDAELAETTVFKREKPDVRAAYHILNYTKMYKATIQEDTIRKAFYNNGDFTQVIEKIIEAMYTALNYDEEITTKYLLAKAVLNGTFYPITVPSLTSDTANDFVVELRTISNDLEFLSPFYNPTGVANFATKDQQYLFLDTRADAVIDVNSLASAFNMDKREFLGHRILMNGLGNTDDKRLAMLFSEDPNYVPFTPEQKAALNTIPGVLVDSGFFVIADKLTISDFIKNPQGLYTNYTLHAWRTFSFSPFANAIVFVPGAPAVTSVTVSPATASVSKGQRVAFSATVITTNFASQSVDWSISGQSSVNTTISTDGTLVIAGDETGTTITVTATSTFDNTKTGTATVTIV